MPSPELRPLQHLRALSSLYPDAWKLVDDLRLARGRALPSWPGWCFLPMAGWYAIISRHLGTEQLPIDRAPDIARMAAIGTWRYTQGVYRLNPDFQEEISDTILSGEMPVDVLLRLPEWCVYVESPGQSWLGRDLHGFWAHLEWDANTQRKELRFLLDTEPDLYPFILHMGPWTVTEAFDRAVSEGLRQHQLLASRMPSPDIPPDGIEELAHAIQPLLSMILYLCSDEPEIEGPRGSSRPRRPQPTRIKHGWRLFPPPGPTIWHVADELGAALREAKAAGRARVSGRSPRTHIRRAHWHGYWTGPRGQQRFRYRWLHPMVVRGRGSETVDQDPQESSGEEVVSKKRGFS